MPQTHCLDLVLFLFIPGYSLSILCWMVMYKIMCIYIFTYSIHIDSHTKFILPLFTFRIRSGTQGNLREFFHSI